MGRYGTRNGEGTTCLPPSQGPVTAVNLLGTWVNLLGTISLRFRTTLELVDFLAELAKLSDEGGRAKEC